MASEEESRRIDEKIRILGNKFATADESGGSQIQNINDDWTQLDESNFSFSSATLIDVSTFDPTTRFEIGDRLWINQASTDKYFNIISVSSTQLTINGGDDYTFTSDTIDQIYSSKLISPSSFPKQFNTTPSVDDGSVTNITLVDSDEFYNLIGATVFVQGYVQVSVGAAGANYCPISIPLSLTGDNEVKRFTVNREYAAGCGGLGRGYILADPTTSNYLRMYDDDGPLTGNCGIEIWYLYFYNVAD